MKLEEALLALGVTRDTDARSVRRAYLRLIKVHSPERDPEQFKRIRRAYELISALAPDASPEPGEAAPPATPPLQLEAADLEREQDLARIAAELRAETNPSRRVRLARDAVERGLGAPAYWLWLGTLRPWATGADIAAVAREALAHGHLEFQAVLRSNLCVGLLDEDELRTWTAEVERAASNDGLTLAQHRLAGGDTVEALRIARLVLGGKPEFVDSGAALELVLGLVASGEPERARAVLALLELALPDPERSDDPVLHEATRELLAIHARLEPSVTSAVARSLAARADDALELPGDSAPRPRDWRKARRVFAKSAPVLQSIYGSAPRPVWVRGSWLTLITWVVLYLAIQLVLPAFRGYWEGPDQVYLSCPDADAAELCKRIEWWNEARGCKRSVAASREVEKAVWELHRMRPLSTAERNAFQAIKSGTQRACTDKAWGAR